MNLLAFTLILMAFSGLAISKRMLGDYFSPPAIYNFFWCFALGSFELNWVDFDPLRDRVWFVIVLAYAGFMGGCLVITLYGFSKRYWLNAPPRFATIDPARFEKALFTLFGLGILGFLVQLAHLQLQVGLTTFLEDPIAAREQHTNIKYLGFFNILNVANFALSLMYLVIYKRPHRWVILIMLWALATTFITTDRTRFFYMVIWAFYIGVYLYRRVDLTPRALLAMAATGLALLGFFLLIAKVYKKEAFDDNMEYVNLSSELAPVVDPYIYLTGSFPVLQAFLNDDWEPAHGKYSLGPVVKVIELFYPEFEREEIIGKFYRVPIELNACTYLEPFYKDFGILGVLIGPLITGLLTMWAYAAMRQRKTLFSVYFASLLSFCATISIFVNHYTQIATWYFVLTGLLVHQYCTTDQEHDTSIFRAGIYETK